MKIIDGHALIARVEELYKRGSVDLSYFNIVREAVQMQPEVDAVPVVHGRWISIPDKPEWDQRMCSVCGDYFCCQNNYCPNCGARMLDGEGFTNGADQ